MTTDALLQEQSAQIRSEMRARIHSPEADILHQLISEAALDKMEREDISAKAARLVEIVRENSKNTMMESFLAEYGLSTKEGVALMCLAEALLRVPDAETINELIEDKITPGKWGEHLGKSASSLVNASTWALMLTGRVIAEPAHHTIANSLRGMVKRLGEPVIRTAIAQAMKELGRQFVLGRDIEEAMERARKLESEGYSYSYDMLGEAARTDADARRYHKAYSDAIHVIAKACKGDSIRSNPGISIKLSALHPRYEFAKKERVMKELVERTKTLALEAKRANMGFNIDAEEADRLDLSLDVIEAVLSTPALAGWDGFGIVVQAYGKRASHTLDWLYNLARRLDRKIMIRLVKGAYWDTEIKLAQTLGTKDFPVFTRKANTDVSYLCCARKLLKMTDRIYPQFATHNAHTVASIMHFSRHGETRNDISAFEFQRLHGMGESLHDAVLKKKGDIREGGARCRIYAPVGAHRDLLAYLVRRLLENGANSSFVNQIVDESITPQDIAADPFVTVGELLKDGHNLIENQGIAKPADIFGKDRLNARGWELTDPLDVEEINTGRNPFRSHQWNTRPLIAGTVEGLPAKTVLNPADPADQVGTIVEASERDIETALQAAVEGAGVWGRTPARERAACLRKTADLFEQHAMEFFALACREAGKIALDAVGEIREAVDFCRFYASECERLGDVAEGRGVIGCISPWNFPLAIFSGQVLASLAAGNAVLAKPAGPTVLIATRATELMHEAGIPKAAMQLLPGSGRTVGTALTSDPRISGVCFTGSTATAQHINGVMAGSLEPDAPLVAETGGLNAMIVDSTALPEQAVRDILASAFQSAGQRCSALRMLYVQNDIKDRFLEMLYGAMDELEIGNPWALSVDVGPVIDQAAHDGIEAHCSKFADKGQVLKRLAKPEYGLFVPPTVIGLNSISELEEEIFGPVLHVAGFEADELDQVIDDINARGFGLTFGLHTRIDSRVDHIINRIRVGNIYVNRNQIGAVVGSQPFGGEGLSGTGPKAGGPNYVARFCKEQAPYTGNPANPPQTAAVLETGTVQQALDRLNPAEWTNREDRLERLLQLDHLSEETRKSLQSLDLSSKDLPGPTGESNRLSLNPRGTVLCLGPGVRDLEWQITHALLTGNAVVAIAAPDVIRELSSLEQTDLPLELLSGRIDATSLTALDGIDVVASRDPDSTFLQQCRQALAARNGVLIPLVSGLNPVRFALERHLCVDTTAAGGNAALLAQASV
ncbi:bifunctional proline dehydrogenase/L-glutamate gamma-semialdehyde dehydrogenase PutA [Kiloniella sp. b19]|uniref:bifunctional proline dehydrogenase/L-glutamate gamma-semialdehyde dehydrogenase PutA n=1 Tax=Kiloniella sp. GXU_MW_B19 TaxID=3141326 RepID=UPI0031CE8FA3